MKKQVSALVVSSNKSGSGKTIFSLFLCNLFHKNGFSVRAFKCGPDYIDTLHLSIGSHNKAYNLDSILMNKSNIESCFYSKAYESDVSVVEGVMGFFDGLDHKSFSGSTYDIAKILNIPVVFIIDVHACSFTAAAIVEGLIKLSSGIRCAGVVLNKVASVGHEKMVRNAIEYHTGLEVMGSIPVIEELDLPSRHLGLKGAMEIEANFYNRITDSLEKYIDTDKIIERTVVSIDAPGKPAAVKKYKKAFVAYDKAFCFYYQSNFDFLEENGFELHYFSPLKNEVVFDADFIYIGGGYPEVFAADISKSYRTLESVRSCVSAGVPTLAECGGMMFLGEGIYKEDKFYSMVGFFEYSVEMTRTLQALGYIQLRALRNSCFFDKGDTFIAHEFHYSKIRSNKEKCIFEIAKLGNRDKKYGGFLKDNVLSTYAHFNFLSDPCIIRKILMSHCL